MKHKVRQMIAFMLVVTLFCSMSVFATDFEKSQMTVETAHIYSILPGTPEWKAMTPDERLSSCRVTKEEVAAMTTAALVETVVKYPYLINMYAYDSIEYGIEMVSNHFPGVKELLIRPDAVQELENYYNREICTEFLTESQQNEEELIQIYIMTLVALLQPNEIAPNRYELPETTTVRTPMGSSVPVTIYETWSQLAWAEEWGLPDQISDYQAEMIAEGVDEGWRNRFSTEVMLDPYNFNYNCFSYAFYKPATTNRYWMDDMSSYITDGSYVYSSAPALHNRVTYVGEYGNITHAGIVYSVSGSSVIVTSKWGYGGLYRHPVYDCPYYIDYPSSVRYWVAS